VEFHCVECAAECDAHTHAECYANADANSDPDTDTNSYPHVDSDTHTYANTVRRIAEQHPRAAGKPDRR
jgi:hypothetical protein